MEKRVLDNGIALIKEDGVFYIEVGGERLETTRDEVLLILTDHDYVFNAIINSKRKYWFNTSMDRYSPYE